MLRFLLSRRWLGLLLVVIVVGVACIELGRWQFRRYDERRDQNVTTERNLEAAPVSADQVLSTEHPPADDDQWRVVSAVGMYDAEHQLLVSYRTRDGAPGVDVVVPLVTESGTALLVDRGWVQTIANANQTPDVPAPPSGAVSVTGWVRLDATGGDQQVTPNDGTIRAISSDAIAPTLPYPVYDGFVDLTSEDPTTELAPQLAEPPDLGSGPHFFYGLQWWFFALLAFGFWCYFAWVEYKEQTRPRPSSQPSVTARG